MEDLSLINLSQFWISLFVRPAIQDEHIPSHPRLLSRTEKSTSSSVYRFFGDISQIWAMCSVGNITDFSNSFSIICVATRNFNSFVSRHSRMQKTLHKVPLRNEKKIKNYTIRKKRNKNNTDVDMNPDYRLKILYMNRHVKNVTMF